MRSIDTILWIGLIDIVGINLIVGIVGDGSIHVEISQRSIDITSSKGTYNLRAIISRTELITGALIVGSAGTRVGTSIGTLG